MRLFNSKYFPFIFFIFISIFWSYFYQSSSWLNDQGRAKPEWLLLIDGLIVLPIVCFCFVKDKKQALIKSITYGCLVILLGSFIIPESSKLYWHYLESGRYLALAGFLLFEITTVITVLLAVRASLAKDLDPDQAIAKPIERLLGQSSFTALLSFEARSWTYCLFSRRINPSAFIGDKHFTYHNKDGGKSNLLGFIFAIAFEIPIMHLLLHFIWSPFAANVVTLLTLLSLVLFIGEYKAVSIRPISVTQRQLIVRYGLWAPMPVNLSDIQSVESNSAFIRRSKDVIRFNLSGVPNVKLALKSGKTLYLGVDNSRQFIDKIKGRINPL